MELEITPKCFLLEAGWGDGSIGQVLAIQESDAQKLCKSWVQWLISIRLRSGEAGRQVNVAVLLAKLIQLKPQTADSLRVCLKTQGREPWRKTSHVNLWPPHAHTQVSTIAKASEHAHTHMCTHHSNCEREREQKNELL